MPQPFIKFFPADWEADAQLMGCSLAARGLWLHMMRVMHESEPYGFFLSRTGTPIAIDAFAMRIGAPTKDVRKAFAELDAAEVFSRDSLGRVYCRRMVRDEAKRQQLLENGTLGLQKGVALPGSLPSNLPPQVPGQVGGQLAAQLVRTRASRAGVSDSQIPRDTDSLRSSAVGFGKWPDEIELLRTLALVFIAAFGNCHDPLKAEKYLPPYTQVLAQMRSRNVTIAEAWQACVDARTANNNKPLFAAAIKSAMSFLPAPKRHTPASSRLGILA